VKLSGCQTFPVRITLRCKSHKKNTAPSASTEYNIYAKFILTSVLSALHRQSPLFFTLHNFYATRSNTSLPAQTTKTKKMEYSKSTDKRFVSADRSAAQRVALPVIVTGYLTTMDIVAIGGIHECNGSARLNILDDMWFKLRCHLGLASIYMLQLVLCDKHRLCGIGC